MPAYSRALIQRLDLLGAALAIAFVCWIGIVAAIAGGSPGPMAGLVLGVVAAVIVASRSGRIHPVLVPALVTATPLIAAVLHRSSPLSFGPHGGPIGYSNASGALFFIAACAAVLAARSARSTYARIAAYLVASAWILLTFRLGADAAAVLSVLLAGLVVLVRRRAAVRTVLLTGAGLSCAGLVFSAVLAGLRYQPSRHTNVLDRWFHSNLGEIRVVLWRDALDLIRAHPLTGVGPGQFREVSPTALADADLIWVHNEYLQVAAETGITGGILLALLLVWAFSRLWLTVPDARALPSVVALGGVSLHANIDFIWHFPEVPLAAAMLVGASSALREPGEPSTVMTDRRAGRRAAFATLGLWAALLLPISIINPPPTSRNGVSWLDDGSGLTFVDRGIVVSAEPPRVLYHRLVSTQAMTVEIWVATADTRQEGPARIVSASTDNSNRNFTLGQDGDQLVFRLRTTRTDPNGTDRQVRVDRVFGTTGFQHLVVATDLDEYRVYVDGELTRRGRGPGGRLDNWEEFPLLLGNEANGDRPWLGSIRHLAIYDRPLTDEEVRHAHNLGMFPSLPAAERLGPTAIALYTFDQPDGTTVADHSEVGLGSPLDVPERFRAPPRRFLEALLDLGEPWPVRLMVHALLFAAWGMLVFRMIRTRIGVNRAVVFVWGAGLSIALGVSFVRYLEGRSASLIDVFGAAIGCGIACLVYTQGRSGTSTEKRVQPVATELWPTRAEHSCAAVERSFAAEATPGARRTK